MTNSNQKERFITKIAMQEQNITVLQNKCEEYLAELLKTKQALDLALDTLKYANNCIKGGCVNWKTEIDKSIDRIIKQITETKDVK